jgi:hypothetical protein
MNNEQEIRAKALEIAAQIYGEPVEPHREPEYAGNVLMEYLPLADLVRHYILSGQKPAVLPS